MKKLFFLMLAIASFNFTLTAQDVPELPENGWKKGASLGLDLGQLMQFNPKFGAGQDRLGVGGAFSVFAKYINGRQSWDNIGSLNLSVQRFGSGTTTLNGKSESIPWQKALDELRLNSKFGYAIAEGSKWSYAVDFAFLSQLTSSYNGNLLKGNDTDLLSKLFSPATINFGIGMDYKPHENFSLFISPVALKTIMVLDDKIASIEAVDGEKGLGKSLHGNPWRASNDFDNIYSGIGASLKATYLTKFLNDRLMWKSQLGLFTDYKNNPFTEIDVDWVNEFGVEIIKGLQLTMLFNTFYDQDVPVQFTDWDKPNGVSGAGTAVSVTEQLLLKYTKNF